MTSSHSRTPARRYGRLAAPVAGLLALALALTACGSDRTVPGVTHTQTVTQSGGAGQSSTASSSSAAPTSKAPTSTKPAKPTGKPVSVISSVIADGSQVGVGLPVILLLSRQIKDARAFAKATKVTVNGKAIKGGWYFERKYQDPGHPVEADYRPQNYWPGHAQIHLNLPVKNLSAGPGLYFKNNLSLDFATGPANVLTVDNSTHKLTVVSDGKTWGSFPVSLGDPRTPTKRGIKVIMEKGRSICMSGPGYHECGVKDTQRLTYDGEYLHAAPWNCTGSPGCTGPQSNIGRGNSSNGCTNLTPTDATKLYNFLEIGDVVQFPNADGPLMQLGDGYGAWNVPWGQWLTGGLYRVS